MTKPTRGPLAYGDSSMDDPSPGPKWEIYVPLKGATAYCWKEADARLYAAAPDMLSALYTARAEIQCLNRELEEVNRRAPHLNAALPCEDVLDQIEAAITRAGPTAGLGAASAAPSDQSASAGSDAAQVDGAGSREEEPPLSTQPPGEGE